MTYLYLKNLLFMAVAQFVQHEKEFPKPRNVERTTIQFHAFYTILFSTFGSVYIIFSILR